jgi:hypothetical protein
MGVALHWWSLLLGPVLLGFFGEALWVGGRDEQVLPLRL